jgi:hypothetical protein
MEEGRIDIECSVASATLRRPRSVLVGDDFLTWALGTAPADARIAYCDRPTTAAAAPRRFTSAIDSFDQRCEGGYTHSAQRKEFYLIN